MPYVWLEVIVVLHRGLARQESFLSFETQAPALGEWPSDAAQPLSFGQVRLNPAGVGRAF